MNSGLQSPVALAPDLKWSEEEWEALLLSIDAAQCTPFIGAGACAGHLPLGGELARMWAEIYKFPFDDSSNLPRVAQFIATTRGEKVPRLRIKNLIRQRLQERPVNIGDPNQTHRAVARLRQPIYLTTNYDRLLSLAIQAELNTPPTTMQCQWWKAREFRSKDRDLDPTPEKPIVFHLHGDVLEPNSIVITEDDYLAFLAAVMEDKRLIPPMVERAFGNSAFLFIGYSLEDMNFKVLFRKLSQYLSGNGFVHVAVQLAPEPPAALVSESNDGSSSTPDSVANAHLERQIAQLRYLKSRYQSLKVKVYWGDAATFMGDLLSRLDAFRK